MIEFQIVDPGIREQLTAAANDVLFAASAGLNRTADEIQRAEQDSLSQHFTLRKADFIRRTIYRDPSKDFATKRQLAAGVRINPDRDFLAKFEQGGLKTSMRGGFVAVPMGARRNKLDIIPRSARPRALIASGRAFVKNNVLFGKVGRGKSARLIALFEFRKAVMLPASLHFEDTALRVANDRLADNVQGAIDRMLSGNWQQGSR